MSMVAILAIVLAAEIVLTIVVVVIALKKRAGAFRALGRARGIEWLDGKAALGGFIAGVRVDVEPETVVKRPGSGPSVVATRVRVASHGESAVLCPVGEVDTMMGAAPSLVRVPTRDGAFDERMAAFGSLPGLADPSVRELVVGLGVEWARRKDHELELVVPASSMADVSRAIDLALALDAPRPPIPLRSGPRRSQSAALGLTLVSGWVLVIVLGGLSAVLVPFTDAAREGLASEVCGPHQHLFVSHVQNGSKTSIGLYCAKKEGEFLARADEASGICALLGADVTAGLTVLVALAIVLARRDEP